MDAIIIRADVWEGLFIDGKLVYEYHEIRRNTLKELCKEYNLKFTDIGEAWVTDEYEDYLCDAGGFHENLSDVKYNLN